ncbi:MULTISPECIES: MATE family efflux transporter [Clostridium]|uniref:MATE family efflux transporter n=1 Tax=Clostridium TaxID=1485 RepID=UPI0008A4DA4C|nr:MULTISPECIES: MATE family efflux transporter [Clostridium]MDB2138611.1 MATE family efflux transporter [Clostridium butyricum]MDU1114678.1 MATE family efflux transporter [Clostridium sp.]MDU1339576.1 MATE family efflux transporter [Clostridium butyricum]MDU4588984.1 MATE family efflux transporter [Clostridium sp.]MDU7713120.1 MATE family efflux transporter [Clostridium butyricum]
MKSRSIFEEKSINQLIVLFSFPTICSLVLESLSSMIDTVFAGHLGNISTIALSAMGIINPILLLLISAQLIFGVSTSLLISKRLGENSQEKINNTFKVGFYSCCISSVSISLLIFLFENQILSVLGASGEVIILAKAYLNIALIFNVFSSTGYMLVNNIRAFGYPKIEIMVGVISTIINIVFNVIFTFILNMGIKGIALSTLISEVFYFGFSIIFLIRKGLWIKKSNFDFKESKEILISLVKIGFVQFLMQSLNSVSGFIINKVLIKYGSVSYVGAWSICSNINMVILLPLIGLTQGVQSVISYFHGSKDKNREDMVKSKIVKYSLIYSICVTVLVYIFSHEILNIFTEDSNLIMLSIPIIKIVVITFPLVGLIYTLITFMQVLGQESSASKLELMRQVVLTIPLVIIIPILFSNYNILNVEPQLAVFFSMPISTILIIIIYFKKIKTILKCIL